MDVLRNLFVSKKNFKAGKGEHAMHAVVYGKEGQVELANDIKVPGLTTTQVLVKVHCAALNRTDLQNKQPGEPLGTEFVGTIEKLGWTKGDKVHMFPFAIGDVVLGMAEGTLADFVCADADKISFVPDEMADEQAAAFPVSGLTAHQALTFNKFTANQTIMVIGASDATAAMFIRQAKLLQAGKIIAVDTGDKESFCESLGADVFIDYESQSLEEVVGPAECDLIVDTLSDPKNKDGTSFEKAARGLLVKGGRFVALNANPVDQLRKMIANSVGFNVQRGGYDTVLLTPKREEIKQLVDWFEAGDLQQSIDSTVKVNDIDGLNAAYEKLASRQANGKIVVRVWTPTKQPTRKA